MNLTDMLKLVTILGFVLNNQKFDNEKDSETGRAMNETLLEIFATLLANTGDADFIVEMLASGRTGDGGELTEQDKAQLDDIRTAVDAVNGHDARSNYVETKDDPTQQNEDAKS